VEVEERDAGEYGLRIGDMLAILQQNWKWVVAAVAACMVAATGYYFLETPIYEAKAIVQLTTISGQEINIDRVYENDVFNRTQRETFLKTQKGVLKSRKFRQKVVEAYEELYPEDTAFSLEAGGIGKLGKDMEIDASSKSELINIIVRSEEHARAANLANLIADLYEGNNRANSQDDAESARTWLGSQMKDYEKRIEASQTRIIAYQRAHNLPPSDEAVNGLKRQLTALQDARAQVSAERIQQDSRVRTLIELRAQGDYAALAQNVNSQLIDLLTGDRAKALAAQAQMASRYGAKHPALVQQRSQLVELEAELNRELDRTLAAQRAQLDVLEARELDLRAEIGLLEQKILDVMPKEAELRRLRDQHDRDVAFYASLAKRNNELELASQTQLSNVRIVDYAQQKNNPTPVEPQPKLVYGFAALAGLGLGIGGVLARDFLNDSISTALDVDTHLRVPYLGLVPAIDDVVERSEIALYTHINPKSVAAETMRSVRTVLEMNPHASHLRRILVTSATAGEGKTCLTVHLGIAFARLGKRVIIVDAELRHPKLHQIFQIPRENGLSAVLDGLDLDAAIHQTEVPNLHVLPAGAGGERSNELLASVYLTEVLESLDQRYDLLILDTPPAGMVPDAAILSKSVDGVIMLVRENRTSREKVRNTLQILQQVGARVLGVVLSGVDLTRNQNHPFGDYGHDGGRDDREAAK